MFINLSSNGSLNLENLRLQSFYDQHRSTTNSNLAWESPLCLTVKRTSNTPHTLAYLLQLSEARYMRVFCWCIRNVSSTREYATVANFQLAVKTGFVGIYLKKLGFPYGFAERKWDPPSINRRNLKPLKSSRTQVVRYKGFFG